MYFIAIVLPEEINQSVLKLKHLMLEKFGCKVGLKSPAHITIIPPYWMTEDLEQPLLQDMDFLSKTIPAFSLTLSRFSAFKPRTIFIDVPVPESLAFVKKTTERFFKTHTHYKAKIDNRPFHPHITIATRDLHKKAFAEAWPLFENKPFAATFEATGLSVLRHNKKDWDVIHTSPFQPALA
jgi:2'-5' RNA ligase